MVYYDIINAIKADKTIAKHILKHKWLSGSSTEVHPIAVWQRDVCIQLDIKRNVFTKAIKRVLINNPNLFKSGTFCRNDDSCPATISFYYTDDAKIKLQCDK